MDNQNNSTKNKHLTLSDRIKIEQLLNENNTFAFIADEIGKSATTISNEVKKHRFKNLRKNTFNGKNDCKHMRDCPNLKYCKGKSCDDYEYDECTKLLKPPYVCNPCKSKYACRKYKWTYSAKTSYDNYRNELSDSRKGINLSQEEFNDLDNLVSPLIVKGQSPYHIYRNHKNEIACTQRTLYRYLSDGALSASIMDLQRQIRYKPRKSGNDAGGSRNYEYRQGRTYKDFLEVTNNYPNCNIVEMDTVCGCEGSEKVLLTLFFRSCSFMLAFLMPDNTQESVISKFRFLQQNIETDSYKKLFPIILTDNGAEFRCPTKLEFDPKYGEQVSQVFFCDPCATNQKSRIERNHELIRYVVPKKKSFDSYSQADITKLINHINSLTRKSLNNNTPFHLASMLLDEQLFLLLDLKCIPPDEVCLKEALLK